MITCKYILFIIIMHDLVYESIFSPLSLGLGLGLGICLGLGAVLYFSILTIVPHGHVAIVEKWGKYNRTLSPGKHILIPILDHLKTVSWNCWTENVSSGHRSRQSKTMTMIPTSECILDLPPMAVATRDQREMTIDTVLFYRITAADAIKAAYSISDLFEGILQLVVTSCRSAAANLNLDDIIKNRQMFVKAVAEEMSGHGRDWGVSIRLEIQNITGTGLTEIMRTTESVIATRRKVEAEIEQEKLNMTKELLKLENEQKMAETRWKYKYENMMAEMKSDIKKCEQEGVAEGIRYTQLIEAGMSEEFILQKARVTALQAMAQKTQSFVMPWEFFKTIDK
jgi:regulator of protease activity HflC (stomatin/prohibitin superfamily)